MTVYKTRYQAEKVRRNGEEVVVRVCGGYAVMAYADYEAWKKQK